MPRYCPSHHADGKDAYGKSCKGREMRGEDGCMWLSKRKNGKWSWVRVNPDTECARRASKAARRASKASHRGSDTSDASSSSDAESSGSDDVRDRKTCKSMTLAEIRDTDEFEQVPGRWRMKKATLCDKISKLPDAESSSDDDDDELKELDKELKKLGITKKGVSSSRDEITKISRRLDMILRAEEKNKRQREKLERAKMLAQTLANTLTNGREQVLNSIMPQRCQKAPSASAPPAPSAAQSCPPPSSIAAASSTPFVQFAFSGTLASDVRNKLQGHLKQFLNLVFKWSDTTDPNKNPVTLLSVSSTIQIDDNIQTASIAAIKGVIAAEKLENVGFTKDGLHVDYIRSGFI